MRRQGFGIIKCGQAVVIFCQTVLHIKFPLNAQNQLLEEFCPGISATIINSEVFTQKQSCVIPVIITI